MGEDGRKNGFGAVILSDENEVKSCFNARKCFGRNIAELDLVFRSGKGYRKKENESTSCFQG